MKHVYFNLKIDESTELLDTKTFDDYDKIIGLLNNHGHSFSLFVLRYVVKKQYYKCKQL